MLPFVDELLSGVAHSLWENGEHEKFVRRRQQTGRQKIELYGRRKY